MANAFADCYLKLPQDVFEAKRDAMSAKSSSGTLKGCLCYVVLPQPVVNVENLASRPRPTPKLYTGIGPVKFIFKSRNRRLLEDTGPFILSLCQQRDINDLGSNGSVTVVYPSGSGDTNTLIVDIKNCHVPSFSTKETTLSFLLIPCQRNPKPTKRMKPIQVDVFTVQMAQTSPQTRSNCIIMSPKIMQFRNSGNEKVLSLGIDNMVMNSSEVNDVSAGIDSVSNNSLYAEETYEMVYSQNDRPVKGGIVYEEQSDILLGLCLEGKYFNMQFITAEIYGNYNFFIKVHNFFLIRGKIHAQVATQNVNWMFVGGF